MTAAREDQELRVVVRIVSRVQQILAGVGGHRPVVVLTRAVDARERLLMQQAGQAVFVGHAAERLHDQVLVIGREIRVLEDRGDFVLAGSHFVVAGLHRNAELGQLEFHFRHARQHALRNDAEILIFQLLALGRLGAKERAAGVDQVGPRKIEVAIDQEVFLLGADGREDVLDIVLAEELEDAHRPAR